MNEHTNEPHCGIRKTWLQLTVGYRAFECAKRNGLTWLTVGGWSGWPVKCPNDGADHFLGCSFLSQVRTLGTFLQLSGLRRALQPRLGRKVVEDKTGKLVIDDFWWRRWMLALTLYWPLWHICTLHLGTNLFSRKWRHGNRILISCTRSFFEASDEKALNFESVLLGGNWSQKRGSFGGSIEFSCELSLGVKGLRSVWVSSHSCVFALAFVQSPLRCILATFKWNLEACVGNVYTAVLKSSE